MSWSDFKYDILYNKLYKSFISKLFIKYDTWNLDIALCDWLIYRLLYMINHHHGYPVGIIDQAIERGLITKEAVDDINNASVQDKVSAVCDDIWCDELYEIAKGLASYKAIDKYTKRFYKKECLHLDELYEFEITCKNRFMDSMYLLIRYFDNLWD